jgi:hypothetical protein
MRLFNSSKASQPDPLHELSRELDTDLQVACSRYEPDVLTEQRVPVDPYLEWAARRDEQRELEDPTTVRWVYRYHHQGATATVVR